MLKMVIINKSKDELLTDIKQKVLNKSSSKLLNVINGTGIVLHTGFGRAPYKSESLKNLANKMEGYINLEYDIENGKRGIGKNIFANFFLLFVKANHR